jgi:hypothetical protein
VFSLDGNISWDKHIDMRDIASGLLRIFRFAGGSHVRSCELGIVMLSGLVAIGKAFCISI